MHPTSLQSFLRLTLSVSVFCWYFCKQLTHKPTYNLQQTAISNFAAFSKITIRHDISWESSAGRQFSWNIIPYFFRKLGKMLQNLSSAAVVIGALRVKLDPDQAWQNVGPDLYPNCLSYTYGLPERIFWKNFWKKQQQQTTKNLKKFPACKELIGFQDTIRLWIQISDFVTCASCIFCA